MRFFVFLCLLTHSALSLALGLGDIELKSHLGEPLSTRVEVTDYEAEPEASCFTATDAGEPAAFKKAYIGLKKSNNNYLLTVTTYDVITEPIVSLRISYHCEPHMNREYVLLMDPAPLVSAEKVAPQTTNTQAANLDEKAKAATNKPKQATAETQKDSGDTVNLPNTSDDAIPEPPVKKKRSKKKKVVSTPTVDDKLMEAYTGKQQTAPSTNPVATPSNPPSSQATEPKTATDKPFLVISGGSGTDSTTTSSSLSLRLETQIDFNRVETGQPPLSATDTMDEVTVMANRLAHLEKQILSLQTKNAQLLAEAEKAKSEGFSFKLSDGQYKWLHHILVTLGIIAALACAEWLRRKIMRHRLKQDEAVWFNAEENIADEPDLDTHNIGDIETAIFGEPELDASQNGRNINQNETGNQATPLNDEEESVLDHADVFIAHGRPTLAIQLLQNHLEESPADSPAVWLKLMTLLAQEGMESEYESAVAECNQFFNIKMPSFSDVGIPDNSSIEDHPHIITRLEGVWGSQYATGFLNDLIFNQQSQPREGFERGTFEELFFLKQIADILQSKSGAGGAGNFYKPEVIQPILRNVAVNQAVFSEKAVPVSEQTTQISAVKLSDAELNNANSELSVEEFFDAPEAEAPPSDYEVDMLLDIEELPSNVSSIGIDRNLRESLQNGSLQADEIDFSVSGETEPENVVTIESIEHIEPIEPIEPEEPEEIAEEITFTELDDDALAINEYLSKAETKAKAPKKKSDDDNVIEFDWDLPKVDKD